jgi:hypothetical protein
VPQQVDDPHRRARRRRREARRARAAGKHAETAPSRDVAMHRVVERDLALLDEHHESDRCQRLGHRIDAEDRVGGERHCALDVGMADEAGVGGFAKARDADQRAGQLAGGDVFFLEKCFDPREAVDAETQFGGVGAHSVGWSKRRG